MGKPKNFYDFVCITTDQQSGEKGQTYLGRFTSRKKADEEIRKTKIITIANNADAEFVINVTINYVALGRSPPTTARLRFVEEKRESFGLFEPIRELLESDKSDVIPCWALDSVIRDTIIIRIDTANLAAPNACRSAYRRPATYND